MTPLFTSCSIYRPGLKADGSVGDAIEYVDMRHLDDALRIYCVERKAIARSPDDLKIDTGGILQETVFAVFLLDEVEYTIPGKEPWLSRLLSEGSFEDLNASTMEALYEAALARLPNPKQPGLPGIDEAQQRTVAAKEISVGLVTFWEVHTSRDWESGIEDVDHVSFEGAGKILPEDV